MSLVSVFLACALLLSLVSVGDAKQRPDGEFFLKGVESVRLQTPPTHLRLRVAYGDLLSETAVELLVDFDYDKRRFVKRAGRGLQVQSIFDGAEVLHFDGENSVTIRATTDVTPDYLFDPRLLGITTTYRWRETISDVLRYGQAPRVETIGREKVDDREAWHVRFDDSYEQQYDLWIDEMHDFRVYRYDFSIPGVKRNSTISYYENDDYPWLPNRVETRYYNGDGQETSRRLIVIVESEGGVNQPDDTWGLAGLELPIGVPVSDLRIGQRIGYWDGHGLSELPVNTDPQPLPSRTPIFLICGFVISTGVIILSIFLYRRFASASKHEPVRK